jgi:hypothetical protein
MAGPAKSGGGPYDEPGNAESPAPNLKSSEEAGTPKKRAEGSDYDKQNLAKTEENGGSFYTSSRQSKPTLEVTERPAGGYRKHAKPSGAKTWLDKNRRKLIGGGSVVTILVALAIALFIFVLPLKIMHIVNNLQQHFFASSQSAVDKETNVLMTSYLKKYVFPGLRTCRAGQATTKNCVPKEVQGNTYVSKLYKSWRNDRLEKQLADNYGLEFERRGNSIFMKSVGLPEGSIKLDDDFVSPGNPESLDRYMQRKVSRPEARAAIKDALDGQTRYTKVMYRFKVGRLLEEKYGIRRCIVFCKTTDKFDDWKDRKKDAAKAYIIDRIITPRSASLSVVLGCVMTASGEGSPCSVTPDDPATACGSGDCALNGQSETNWEKDLRSRFASYRATFGNEAADQLLKEVDLIRQNGYWTYVFNKALQPSFNHEAKARQSNIQADTSAAKDEAAREAARQEFAQTLTDKLTKGGNIVGALDTTASILDTLRKSGPEIHKLTYVTNAATMVTVFSTYRTYADEIKTGHVDAAIVGSFTKTLDSGMQDGGTLVSAKQVGGTAGAEQAPLYQSLIDDQPVKKVTVDPKSNYHCGVPSRRDSTDHPIEPGKLICDEENLTINHTADELNGAAKTEPLATLSLIADKWVGVRNSFFGGIIKAVNWTLSKLTSFITSVLSIIPGSDDVIRAIEKYYDKLMQWLVTSLIPSPIAENTSGARMFDAMAGGADVAGNDYAHHGLGGKALSNQQISVIRADQQQLALAQYQSQPLTKRVFNTDSNFSPAAKIAAHLPSNKGELANSLAGSFGSNLIGRIFHSFGSLFSLSRAQAASNIGNDPFGVTQYGYPDDDPGLAAANQDPESYWQANCAANPNSDAPDLDLSQAKTTYKWNKDANSHLNSQTYMPENGTTNPCLLIQAAVGSAGGRYDSSLLAQDDLSDNAAASEPGNGSDSLPNGSAKELASQLKQFLKNGQLKCASVGCPDIIHTADSVSIRGGQGCTADALQPALLGMLLKLLEMGHSFTLSALCSDHHNDGPAGHAGGRAADFNTIDGVFMGPNDTPWSAAKLQAGKKLDQDIASFMPKSTGFGQAQCHPAFDFLSGFSVFNDSCHHQHIQVEG